MQVFYYNHQTCLQHLPGHGHPERPERLTAIQKSLQQNTLSDILTTKTPLPVETKFLYAIHDQQYVDSVLAVRGKNHMFDADTCTSEKSIDAALLAAGAAVEATKQVLEFPDTTAFCAVRPPGHHAEKDRAMGFCFFNNAAIAAQAALDQGIERVLIFDPDVHHGNGTQHIFYNRADVFYVSIHQFPFYPGTGNIDEVGETKGKNYTLNLPLPGGMGDAEFLYLTETVILKVIKEYKPQLIIFSAGFDAHVLDPLGGMRVSSEGFVQMYQIIMQQAQQANIPYFYVLEGGYSLEGLSTSVSLLLKTIAKNETIDIKAEKEVNALVESMAQAVLQRTFT